MNIFSLQPLKNHLRDEVNDFVEGVTRTDTYQQLVFNRLMAECRRLQETDVVQASLICAFLNSSIGQFEEVDRWLRNAALNGGADEARIERFTHYVNHGFASQALELIDDIFSRRAGKTLMDLARGAVAIGAFTKVVKAVEASRQNNEVLTMTGLHKLACRAASVLGQLGVSDSQIAAMLNVAGESLRSKKLLWVCDQPDITVLDASQGGPALAFEYRVYVTPAEAAKMTWDLTEALITRELDRPNVSVGFLGTDLQGVTA